MQVLFPHLPLALVADVHAANSIVLAGCDGHKFNETVYTLDLAAAAFYPQVTKWRFGDCVAVPEAEE